MPHTELNNDVMRRCNGTVSICGMVGLAICFHFSASASNVAPPAPTESATSANQPPWGEAVDGVECRLRAEKAVWQSEKWPKFRADLRNQGMRRLSLSVTPESWKVEVDGVWYHSTVSFLGTVGTLPLPPGQQKNDIRLLLIELSKWRSEEENKPLTFNLGEHTVRFALKLSPEDGGEAVSVVSNPVETTIEPALPGAGLSIAKAIKEKAAFAAVCEAVEAGVPVRGISAPGIETKRQVFKVIEVLFGNAEVVDRVKLDYRYVYKEPQYERAIRKGERVIWIGHTRNMGFHGSLYGLKALPDIPENRQAVKAAGSQAATGWGEAVDGVQVRLRCDRQRWHVDETITWKIDVRNTGKRHLRFAPHAYETVKIDVDGRILNLPSTRGIVRSYELEPGQEHRNIFFSVSRRWQLEDHPFDLKPGKHRVKITFAVHPAKGESGDRLRVTSNPVEITIEPALPGARLSIDKAASDKP